MIHSQLLPTCNEETFLPIIFSNSELSTSEKLLEEMFPQRCYRQIQIWYMFGVLPVAKWLTLYWSFQFYRGTMTKSSAGNIENN